MNENDQFHGVQKIVSGGQTGVDQAALDVAMKLGIPHGGWCPRGRISEAGRIDTKYQLTELPSRDYAARTQQNVIDSDGTLILYRVRLQGGTALTYRLAKEFDKPLQRVRLDRPWNAQRVALWLREHEIRILNVAGPRASSHPQLYEQSFQALLQLFGSPSSLLLP